MFYVASFILGVCVMYTYMSPENSDEKRNYTETVSTRVSSRTKRRFDRYREANELAKSQALRELIRSGLKGEETSARRDLADVAISFFIGVFAVSMISTYSLRTVAVAVAGGLFVASIVTALKFGRYDIRITIINREKYPEDAVSTGSGISFASEPSRSTSPTVAAKESEET
jgi:Flp pilus assembly protein TadB